MRQAVWVWNWETFQIGLLAGVLISLFAMAVFSSADFSETKQAAKAYCSAKGYSNDPTYNAIGHRCAIVVCSEPGTGSTDYKEASYSFCFLPYRVGFTYTKAESQ